MDEIDRTKFVEDRGVAVDHALMAPALQGFDFVDR